METLKLFDANNNVYTNAVLGKQIWELTKSFPNEKLGTIIKSRTTSTETEGRKSYWTYVFLYVCGLKKELEELGESEILENYKSYLFMNYVKILKTKIGHENNINDEFKKYFVNLFLNTFAMPERELREFLKQETENINSGKLQMDIQIDKIKKEMELSDKKIKELKAVNKSLKENINEREELKASIKEIHKRIKCLEIKTVITLMFINTVLMFVLK